MANTPGDIPGDQPAHLLVKAWPRLYACGGALFMAPLAHLLEQRLCVLTMTVGQPRTQPHLGSRREMTTERCSTRRATGGRIRAYTVVL
jgi:hypothetical protein